MSFYAVFVPGLAEKMFPRKIVEEPILLDTVREGIGGLATNQTRLEEERLALALVAGAAEQRICFSYSRLDLDRARPRVHLSMVLKPFEPPKVFCPTSPNSHDELRQRRAPASDGPPNRPSRRHRRGRIRSRSSQPS